MKALLNMQWIVGCLLALAVIACEDNELQIEGFSPKVEATFINNDSLAAVDSLIIDYDTLISRIGAKLDSLDSLDLTAEIQTQIDSLELEEDLARDERSDINAIKNIILRGLLQIDFVTGIGNFDNITYEDSLSTYQLPLNVNADSSEFLIRILDKTMSLFFTYKRDTFFTEGRIIIEADSVKLRSFKGADSVIYNCDNVNCKSYEARATIYF